jgi:hypothetical protein
VIPFPDHTAEILNEIAGERVAQIEKGYDPEHDDALSVGRLIELAESRSHRRNHDNPGYYSRAHLIEAAALMVAAIEVLDRSEAGR